MAQESQKTKSECLAARIRRAALLAFMHNLRDREIAKVMEISVHTVADWKQRPEWQEAIDSLAWEMWATALKRLKIQTDEAVKTIVKLLSDESPMVRLNAAKYLLERGLPPSL